MPVKIKFTRCHHYDRRVARRCHWAWDYGDGFWYGVLCTAHVWEGDCVEVSEARPMKLLRENKITYKTIEQRAF